MRSKLKTRLGKMYPALTHRNFQYFFFGQLISLLGTWMQRTAQQWLVYTLTKSAFLLGVLGVAQFGPMLLFTLFSGVLVDRFPKKKIMIITQFAFMIQSLTLAIFVWMGNVRYWEIIILAAVFGLLNAVDKPCRQSFFIELVGREDLPNAIALNSSIVNFSKISGPAVAAILIAKFGVAFCIFFNGISFIPVIACLSLIKPLAVNIYKKDRKILKDVRNGINYIWKSTELRTPILVLFAVGAFAINMDVIIPVFSVKVLNQGVYGYGFLLSAMGLGSFAGAFIVATGVRKFKQKSVFWLAILISLFMVLTSFIRYYPIMVLLIICIGFLNTTFLTAVNTTVQLNSRDESRGLVMSVYTLGNTGMTPIGNFFAGSIMEVFGAAVGLFICGSVAGIFVLMLIIKTQVKKHTVSL